MNPWLNTIVFQHSIYTYFRNHIWNILTQVFRAAFISKYIPSAYRMDLVFHSVKYIQKSSMTVPRDRMRELTLTPTDHILGHGCASKQGDSVKRRFEMLG